MTEGPQVAPGPELVAIARLWRASGRQIVTSFLGTSMLPTIAPGIELTIDCAHRWDAGDIIAYVVGSTLIVHRIEAVAPDRRLVLTRGDHHRIPDDPFDPGEGIIGTIVQIRRGDEWVAPPGPPHTWLRAFVLRLILPSFARNAGSCRRRLMALRALTRPAIIPPLVIGKLRRMRSGR